MGEALEVRNQYRLSHWTQVVKKCQESGMSNRAYCEANGISEKTYYYRLRRLRTIAADIASPQIVKLEPHLLPSGGEIKLIYHGITVEIRNGVDRDTLTTVLQALQGL